MATNGVPTNQNARTAAAKPAPTGPAPPAPAPAPPTAPTNTSTAANGATSHGHPPATNAASSQKGKKKAEAVDPVTMYETVRNRIAALEEEEVHGEEEERRIADEARRAVKGVSESGVHAKYVDLFQELKRAEREHAKEKQKLIKDKDNAKNQLTKANQNKTRFENVARELQKENKKLREDNRIMSDRIQKSEDEILNLKNEMERRADKAKKKEKKYIDSPDIVVKVVCKYRAELFFKISRKTKLTRLFNAWTERMEIGNGSSAAAKNARRDTEGSDTQDDRNPMIFLFTHMGKSIEPDQTPEDIGMEDGDEILAVEMMDLTKDESDDVPEPQRERLKKNWTDDPQEAKQALEEIFDDVARERLKDVLRQYELREKHFDCVIRSKELEVLLSRARTEEQRSLVEQERRKAAENEAKTRELNEEAHQLKEQSSQIHQQLQRLKEQSREINTSQARLLEDLRACCEAPTPERTQRLFLRLREELEKRDGKLPDGPTTTGTGG
ncbi:hypothetical protein M422DRAFT_25368 [Sphaerobolus stellatus SS14]|nr:hypothetical protein M422DRAFT_25368 [Sphaerobolus stellatus SS14]